VGLAIWSIFPTRRYAKRAICHRRVSVRVSVCVCLSLTSASRGPSAIAELLVKSWYSAYVLTFWRCDGRGIISPLYDFDRVFDRVTAMRSAVYAIVVCLCVCVAVCLSITLRYCMKTAKRRITQITPHESPMTLVFWRQRSRRNSNGITPYGGDECRWGGLKLVTFEEKRAITRKRYKMDA